MKTNQKAAAAPAQGRHTPGPLDSLSALRKLYRHSSVKPAAIVVDEATFAALMDMHEAWPDLLTALRRISSITGDLSISAQYRAAAALSTSRAALAQVEGGAK